MIFAILCLFAVAAVNGQDLAPYRYHNPHHYYYDESPKPYAFNYNAPLDFGGESSRAESADGSGKVEGSYTVTNDEGHTRVVDYVADQAGFRANVRTNEPGTDNQNPADVTVESAAPFTHGTYQQYAGRYGRPYGVAGQPIAAVDGLAPGSPAFYNANPYNRNSLYNRYNRNSWQHGGAGYPYYGYK